MLNQHIDSSFLKWIYYIVNIVNITNHWEWLICEFRIFLLTINWSNISSSILKLRIFSWLNKIIIIHLEFVDQRLGQYVIDKWPIAFKTIICPFMDLGFYNLSFFDKLLHCCSWIRKWKFYMMILWIIVLINRKIVFVQSYRSFNVFYPIHACIINRYLFNDEEIWLLYIFQYP